MRDPDMIDGTNLAVWQERDRLHIHLTDRDGETVAEWWDDAARALIEDNGLRSANDHAGIVRMCRQVGIIRNVAIVWSINALRDESGWSENDRSRIGTYVNLPDSNRALLRWLRARGILKEGSQGRGMVDDCGTAGMYLWICERSDRQPVIAVQFLDSSDTDR